MNSRIVKTFIPDIPIRYTRKMIVDKFVDMKIGKVIYFDRATDNSSDISPVFLYLSLFDTENAKKWEKEINEKGNSKIVYDKESGLTWKTMRYLDRMLRSDNKKCNATTKKTKTKPIVENRRMIPMYRKVEDTEFDEKISKDDSKNIYKNFYKIKPKNKNIIERGSRTSPTHITSTEVQPNAPITSGKSLSVKSVNDDIVYVPPHKRKQLRDIITTNTNNILLSFEEFFNPKKHPEFTSGFPYGEPIIAVPFTTTTSSNADAYASADDVVDFNIMEEEIFGPIKVELEKQAFYELWGKICVDFGVTAR